MKFSLHASLIIHLHKNTELSDIRKVSSKNIYKVQLQRKKIKNIKTPDYKPLDILGHFHTLNSNFAANKISQTVIHNCYLGFLKRDDKLTTI